MQRCNKNWPVVHLNGNTAKSTTLLNGPTGALSHYVSGYQLDGALATGDGFYILRRSCLYFNTNDTWTVADTATILDWGSEADSGHFALEVWVYVPTATGAVANLMVRGDEAANGWKLEVTSAGKAKFTARDGAHAVTITGTRSIFGGWHLITVVCQRNSATGLNLYIDGQADATAVDTRDMDDALDGGTTVVCTGVSNKNMWLGPVGMYIGASAALSAATVLANYNEGIGRKYDGSETGLTAAWNNDEGVGTSCYNILSASDNLVAVSGTAWSPSKQSGSTAAVSKAGPPFEHRGEDDADDPRGCEAVGLFGTGLVTASGVMNAIVAKFPEAIRIGRNNPLRILETDGSFSLIVFGETNI